MCQAPFWMLEISSKTERNPCFFGVYNLVVKDKNKAGKGVGGCQGWR